MRRALRNIVGSSLTALLAGFALAPAADAAFNYSGLTVTQNGKTAAYGYGNIDVRFLNADNNAWARTGAYNGRGVYIMGSAWNSGQTVSLRSLNTTSTSYKNVSVSRGYGAPTAGPWSGSAKACVDLEWAVDLCGAQKSGGV